MEAEPDTIARLAAGFAGPEPSAIVAAVRDRLEPGIDEFLGKTAYWHPVGFFRVELGRESADVRYALHIWPTGYRATQDPPWLTHGHLRELWSCILAGRLVDTEFEVLDPSEPGDMRGIAYVIDSADGVSYMRRAGDPISLRELSVSTKEPGDYYLIPPANFHNTLVAPDEFTVTAVRIGRQVRDVSQVVGDDAGLAEYRYERETADPAVVAAALNQLREVLLSRGRAVAAGRV